MWLSSSSVGRKFIMALTGAVLVLFVTFHCLMNAVAILWPTAYNSVCMFLGANWYALIASAGLALFILVHIIYAVVLTVQNNKARGNQRYAIAKRPATVEWSSQNMFVLGIVILAFLVVHMIQFWAKMQLVEVLGCETTIPATAGTLFLQEAFSQPWTIVVYVIAFVALWFHLTHGFWSMFQSVGWDNTTWIPRLKCIGNWWVSIVVGLFVIEAVVFTINAKKDYYKTNPDLQQQYFEMVIPETMSVMGDQVVSQMLNEGPENIKNASAQVTSEITQLANDRDSYARALANNPDINSIIEGWVRLGNFCNYLDGKPTIEMPKLPSAEEQQKMLQEQQMMQQQMMQMMQQQQMPQVQPQGAPAEQGAPAAAQEAPAEQPNNQ